MTSNRRGFSRERHTELKLLISTVATVAFGLSWLGFSRAHEPEVQVEASTALSTPAAPLVSPTVTISTPVPVSSAAATVAPAASAPAVPSGTGGATPSARKRSRGS